MQLSYILSIEAGTYFRPEFETIIKLGLVLEVLSAIVKLKHFQPPCWLGTIDIYV